MPDEQAQDQQDDAQPENQPAGAGRDDGNGGGADGDDAAALKATLRKERDRARAAERDLKALQKRLTEFEDRDKTELQKAQDRAAELEGKVTAAEQRIRDTNGRTAVYDAVASGKPNAAVSAKAVWALAREALEYDDDGEPTNVDAVLAKLRKDEPTLFRASPGKGDGGAGGSAATSGDDMNAVLRRMAGAAR